MKTLRFPRAALAFVLFWAFMAFFPPTREVFRAALAAKNLSAGQDPREVKARLAAWSRQFPDSVLLEAWRREGEMDFRERSSGGLEFSPNFRATLREMDALVARFPADSSLRAQRVRMSLIQPIGDQTSRKQHGMNAADYTLAAQVAQGAEKREPDNGFWPWADAAFQFALGNQPASLAALERAARCPRFDNYALSTTRARAAWLQRVAHPTWEEKQTFPFVSPGFGSLGMGKTLESATQQALSARKAGDPARAVSIEAAVLGAAGNWRRSDNDIDARVSEYQGRRMLQQFLGLREPKSGPYSGENWNEVLQLHKTRLANDWAALSRQNGHPEWASRADFLRAPEADNTYDFYDLWREFGLPAPWGRIATLGPMVLMALAALCWGGALMWLLGEVFRRITQRTAEHGNAEHVSAELGSAERGQIASGDAGSTRGQVAACVNFSAWSLGGTLAVCLVGLGWSHLDFWSVSAAVRDGQMAGTAALLSLIVAGSWLLPVAYTTWKRAHSRARATHQVMEAQPGGRGLRVSVWALFLLIAAGLFLKISQPYSVKVASAYGVQMAFWIVLTCASLAGALCLEWARYRRSGAHLRAQRERPATSAVPRLMRTGLWLLGPVFGFAAWQTEGFEALWLAVFAVATLAAAFWLEWKGERREGFAFALQLATRSAGVLALVWSVVFAMGCVRLWPVRVELNRQSDRRLQIGERAWTREKSAEQTARAKTP